MLMLEQENEPKPQPNPSMDDSQAWLVYWEAQHQTWRTEPEIDEQRQTFLTERRAIDPGQFMLT